MKNEHFFTLLLVLIIASLFPLSSFAAVQYGARHQSTPTSIKKEHSQKKGYSKALTKFQKRQQSFKKQRKQKLKRKRPQKAQMSTMLAFILIVAGGLGLVGITLFVIGIVFSITWLWILMLVLGLACISYTIWLFCLS